MSTLKQELPPVPAKRYFTIGEVADLCLVKQHVLRYWEQEFAQLKPMKRRGNRRYYQHHEVMLIRRIRSLLYDDGFTINGARTKLDSLRTREPVRGFGDVPFDRSDIHDEDDGFDGESAPHVPSAQMQSSAQRDLEVPHGMLAAASLRVELLAIRALLA